jgi:hypothetical protein
MEEKKVKEEWIENERRRMEAEELINIKMEGK